MGHIRDAALEQRGIGGFQRHVRAAAHGDTHVGGRQGRRVVDAVADHRHLGITLHLVDQAQLVLRQQLGLPLDAQLAGDRLRGAAVVAGQHDRAHAHGVELGHAFARVAAGLVAQGQQAQNVLAGFVEQDHHGLAAILQLVDFPAVRGCQRGRLFRMGGRSDSERTAVHGGAHRLAGNGRCARGLGNRHVQALGMGDNGLRQGMV